MNNFSKIISDKFLMECVAYLYCKEINISKYQIPMPSVKVINKLINEEVISKEKNQIIDKELGYACYEHYRQNNNNDFFDQLLVNKSKNKKVILDLCCGPGATVQSLCRYNPEIIYAMDINPRYISIVKEIFPNNNFGGTQVIPILGDAHSIPLKNETVDYVVCRVSIQYLAVDIVLKEIYRVLKRGGTIFLIVHGSGYLLNYFFMRKKLLSKDSFSFFKNIFIRKESVARAKFLFSGNLIKKLDKIGFIENQLLTNNSYKELRYFPVYFALNGNKK
ncbi:class I SAM-dependent methyltransferase [Bacillus sp. OTU2372]|uniref:class I SAM-dependent methyltransferase n=1 Tax=Bacillus sp. OTU2372 TaxID=3043858 RepID=UPI00313A784D